MAKADWIRFEAPAAGASNDSLMARGRTDHVASGGGSRALVLNSYGWPTSGFNMAGFLYNGLSTVKTSADAAIGVVIRTLTGSWANDCFAGVIMRQYTAITGGKIPITDVNCTRRSW